MNLPRFPWSRPAFDRLAPAGCGPDKIVHIKAPLLPQFRFEYHPLKRRVYMIRVGALGIGTRKEIGEPIALHIETEGQAHNAVLTFLRGYRAATAPEIGRLQAAQVN